MNIPFSILLALALASAPATDKLHGKITVSETDRVEIELIIQPQKTTLKFTGPAPVAVGEFVEFNIGPHNVVKIGDSVLALQKIEFVP